MFELMAKGICANPERWKSFLVDKTSGTMIKTLDEAKKARPRSAKGSTASRHSKGDVKWN